MACLRSFDTGVMKCEQVNTFACVPFVMNCLDVVTNILCLFTSKHSMPEAN